MMTSLDAWSNGTRQLTAPEESVLARRTPLREQVAPIELERFMGRWYVIAAVPTYFDRGAVNSIEDYTWNGRRQRIEVSFKMQAAVDAPSKEFKQRAYVANAPDNTRWSLNPKAGGVYMPLGLRYLVAHCSADYSTSIIGGPDRSFVYIMARTPQLEPEQLEALIERVERAGYERSKIEMVTQDYSSAPAPPEPLPPPPPRTPAGVPFHGKPRLCLAGSESRHSLNRASAHPSLQPSLHPSPAPLPRAPPPHPSPHPLIAAPHRTPHRTPHRMGTPTRDPALACPRLPSRLPSRVSARAPAAAVTPSHNAARAKSVLDAITDSPIDKFETWAIVFPRGSSSPYYEVGFAASLFGPFRHAQSRHTTPHPHASTPHARPRTWGTRPRIVQADEAPQPETLCSGLTTSRRSYQRSSARSTLRARAGPPPSRGSRIRMARAMPWEGATSCASGRCESTRTMREW